MIKDSIFLHFTDRELLESVNFKSNQQIILIDALLCALFMTRNIYVAISHFFELTNSFPVLQLYLKKLQDFGEIKNILSSNSMEDFVLKRQSMYLYDRHRYPFYFEDKLLDAFPEYHMILDESTSLYIKRKLESVISGAEHYDFLDSNKIIDVLWQRVNLQVNNAYTSKSFVNLLETDAYLAEQDTLFSRVLFKKIEFLLSLLHNNSYVEKSASSIIVNIPYVNKYDIMMPTSTFDYKVYKTVLSPFLTCLYSRFNSVDDILFQIVAFRNDNYFPSLCEFLNQSIKYTLELYRHFFHRSVYSAISDKVVFDLEKNKSRLNLSNPEFNIQYAFSYFKQLFSLQVESLKTDYKYNSIDFRPPKIAPIDNDAISTFEQQVSINNFLILKAEVTMGDTYNANQVGMQGPNSGHNATITQIYGEKSDVEFDYISMSREISQVKAYIKSVQSEHETEDNDILIGELTKLNKAIENKDNTRILDVLKACGLQIVDIAKRLGCSILVGFILKKLGK